MRLLHDPQNIRQALPSSQKSENGEKTGKDNKLLIFLNFIETAVTPLIRVLLLRAVFP